MMENAETVTEIANMLLPGTKIIKLRGFTRKNKDYEKAKEPPVSWKEKPSMTESEIQEWIKKGGWIGSVIPEGRIIVDIDNSIQGEIVKGLLESENIHHHCIRTPNGWQFVFKAETEEVKKIKQITKYFTQSGVVIDTRTTGAGYIVFPTRITEGRYIVTKSLNELDEVPKYLWPLRSQKSTKNKETGECYEFPIPIDSHGSRNDTLYRFAARLKVWKVAPEDIIRAMELIYEYFVLDKTDFPLSELMNSVRSAINWNPDPTKNELNPEENFPKSQIIPFPFLIENNMLTKRVIKKVEGTEVESKIMVSRMAPRILKELTNVEKNSVHYEIAWTDRGREKKEVVPASTISTKRELLSLADSGLPVNDLNYKDLIKYFDDYLAQNRLEQSNMVERLGHVKNSFIHPLDSDGCEIIPNDIGERQLLEAFEAKGTEEEWKTKVFELIKNHPKVLFLVLASFASVMLRDLKISPFIIDLSGSTSQGKTTALQVARSVWGNEGLISEWNSTKAAIERKAGFLNSFPLYLDDTRKADERILQSIVYQFSGGRSKGRASLKGSQIEMTWNNILISSGEVSLTEYASKAGGAAARIISLVDEPFNNPDYEYFSKLYEGLQNNYGVIGLEFLKKWHKQKNSLIQEFYKFKDYYMEKAKGNEVLTRLSMYYAAVHFAGSVLKNIFSLDINLKQLDQLFNVIAQENKALDKPKELLEQILNELDSSRRSIYYESAHAPDGMKALYKYETLCLTPAYLKEFLGPEEKMVRREWMKKGFTEITEFKNKAVDYKAVFHKGKTFRVVVLNKEIISELGFNFKETS